MTHLIADANRPRVKHVRRIY